MEKKIIQSIVESILFVATEPVTLNRFKEVIGKEEGPQIKEALVAIQNQYRDEAHGISLEEVAQGYQFRTKEDNAAFVIAYKRIRPQRLSKPALDTLAIVAYQQPVTHAQVDKIRGVDSAGTIKHLLLRNLIKMVGKKEEVGRPIIYGTTDFFLESMGFKSLKDLPPLSEFVENDLIQIEGDTKEGGEMPNTENRPLKFDVRLKRTPVRL
jgi:segregation and condensation protein B